MPDHISQFDDYRFDRQSGLYEGGKWPVYGTSTSESHKTTMAGYIFLL